MRSFRLLFLKLILFATWAFTCSAAGAQQPAVTYVFPVLPQYSPAQLHREWFPLIERITRAFLALQRHDSGRDMRRKIPTPQPVKGGYERDYFSLEIWGFQKHLVSERKFRHE